MPYQIRELAGWSEKAGITKGDTTNKRCGREERVNPNLFSQFRDSFCIQGAMKEYRHPV